MSKGKELVKMPDLSGGKKILFYCLIIIISFLLFYSVVNLNVSGDMGMYMNQALNITKGRGNIYFYDSLKDPGKAVTTRAPLFPLFIALAFRLFGISISSAFYAVKAFCLLNVLLVFFLTKILFGKKEALVASFAALFSPGLGFWSYRHLDGAWVTFLLASVIFYALFLKKEKKYWLFFSGVSIGLSFLIKEVAILFFAYPFILAAINRNLRNKKHFLSLSGFLAGILLILIPWFFYVFIRTGSVSTVLGKAVYSGYLKIPYFKNGGSGVLNAIRGYFSGLCAFPGVILKKYYPVFPAFIAGWLYVFFKAFRGDFNARIPVVLLALFSPILAITASRYLRPGQVIFFILISYIALGRFLVFLAGFLFKKHRTLQNAALCAFVIMILTADWAFADKNGKSFIRNNFFARRIFSKNTKNEFSGWYSENPSHYLTGAGVWIKNNAEGGAVILHDLAHYCKPVYFHCRGKARFLDMPVRSLDKNDRNNVYFKNARSADSPVFIGVKPGIFPQHSWLEIENGFFKPDMQFYAVMQEDLFERIKRENVSYIMVRKGLMQGYFDDNPSFFPVAEFNNKKLVMYRVTGFFGDNDREVIITEEALGYAAAIKKRSPETYVYFADNFFNRIAGLEVSNLENVVKSRERD